MKIDFNKYIKYINEKNICFSLIMQLKKKKILCYKFVKNAKFKESDISYIWSKKYF